MGIFSLVLSMLKLLNCPLACCMSFCYIPCSGEVRKVGFLHGVCCVVKDNVHYLKIDQEKNSGGLIDPYHRFLGSFRCGLTIPKLFVPCQAKKSPSEAKNTVHLSSVIPIMGGVILPVSEKIPILPWC